MLVAEGLEQHRLALLGLGVVTLTHMAEAANLLGQRGQFHRGFVIRQLECGENFIDVALVVGDQLAVELAIGAAGKLGSSMPPRRPLKRVSRRIALSIHGP